MVVSGQRLLSLVSNHLLQVPSQISTLNWCLLWEQQRAESYEESDLRTQCVQILCIC